MNESRYFDPADVEQNKVVSALSYLGILFFLPLVACPDSQFGRFHANQSLVLLIASVAVSILSRIIRIIPILGYILGSLISLVAGLGFFALMLYGLINTLQGHAKELPLLGKIQILK